MATSGQTISLITRDDILNDALGHLGVLGEGQTANVAQIAKGTRLLNNIVSEFRTLNMLMYARSTIQITPVVGQDTYTLGVGQTINTPYPTYIYNIVLVQPGGTKFQMTPREIVDFNQLPLQSGGLPVNYNYQAKINTGTLKIWPTPDNSVPVGMYMEVTYQRPIETFVAAGDNPDFPQEWGNALAFALAVVWADTYSVPEAKKAWLEKQADKHVATASSTANEQGSLFIQPNTQQNWNY